MLVILVHLFWDEINQDCRSGIINKIGKVYPPFGVHWNSEGVHTTLQVVTPAGSFCWQPQLKGTVDLYWSYSKGVTNTTEVSKTTVLSRAVVVIWGHCCEPRMTLVPIVATMCSTMICPIVANSLLQQAHSHAGCLVPGKLLQTDRQTWTCP
jgi:hypothetical protein